MCSSSFGSHHLPNPAVPVSEPFPWDDLPLDLKVSILLLLPVSDVAACACASRQSLSLVRSPDFLAPYSALPRHREDIALLVVVFLGRAVALAYHPSRGRWAFFPFPSSVDRVCFFDRTLVHATEGAGHQSILLNVFSQVQHPFPSIPGSLMVHLPLPVHQPYVIAMIEEETSTRYRIVAVVHIPGAVVSMVYDSLLLRWELKGQLNRSCAVLGNSVFLNGLMFVLSGLPDHLLTFDPDTGDWTDGNVELPDFLERPHLLVFEKRLFLVGGISDGLTIVNIQIWELDYKANSWNLVDSMPDCLVMELFGSTSFRFTIVDRNGMIFFHQGQTLRIVMYDMSTRQWLRVPECNLIGKSIRPKSTTDQTFLALELHPQLLKKPMLVTSTPSPPESSGQQNLCTGCSFRCQCKDWLLSHERTSVEPATSQGRLPSIR